MGILADCCKSVADAGYSGCRIAYNIGLLCAPCFQHTGICKIEAHILIRALRISTLGGQGYGSMIGIFLNWGMAWVWYRM